MNVAIQGRELTFTFNLVEGRILLGVLRAIIKNYSLAPEDLDPRSREAWYSARGCQSAGLSAEETREWQRALHEFKRARGRQIQDWYAQLTRAAQGTSRLVVLLDDAPALLSTLNDHRLLMAARHDIGQAEMDAHHLDAAAKLEHPKQPALLEIHFLAWIVEEILRHLPGEPGAWRSEDAESPESTG